MERKTYKREFALALTLWFLGLASFAFFTADTDAKLKILDMLALPVFGTAVTAFGLTWVTKQTNFGGPPGGSQ